MVQCCLSLLKLKTQVKVALQHGRGIVETYEILFRINTVFLSIGRIGDHRYLQNEPHGKRLCI